MNFAVDNQYAIILKKNNQHIKKLPQQIESILPKVPFKSFFSKVNVIHVFYKKLVYKKLALRWLKFLETLVLCLRSTKKLFKVRCMDIIANRSLNLYSWAILSNHLCFQHNRTLFIP